MDARAEIPCRGPPSPVKPAAPSDSKVCRFFLKGACKNGAACRFSHEGAPAPPPEKKKQEGADMELIVSKMPVACSVDYNKDGPFFSVDVESVATGPHHCDRAVARVAVSNFDEEVVYSVVVKPSEPVFSCLTTITGLTPEDIEKGIPLEEALAGVKKVLPSNAVLVGQGIQKDIEWLSLEIGKDFHSYVDLAFMFRIENDKGKNAIWFSLRHEVLWLLDVDIQDGVHNPEMDAIYSIKLFKKYKDASQEFLNAVRQTLLRSPRTMPVSHMYPTLDGVEMGDRKCPKCRRPSVQSNPPSTPTKA